MSARAGVALAQRIRQFGHAVGGIDPRAPRGFDRAARYVQGKRPVANRFADADRLLHRAVLQIKSRFARLVRNDAEERRHGHNRSRLHALNHFQHQRGRRRTHTHHATTKFAQAQPISQPRHETAVHRHRHQHCVARRQAGAREREPFVRGEPLHVRLRQHPQQRLAGRAARGDDFHHAFARHAQKIQIALRDDVLVHGRNTFQRRHALCAAKQLAVIR